MWHCIATFCQRRQFEWIMQVTKWFYRTSIRIMNNTCTIKRCLQSLITLHSHCQTCESNASLHHDQPYTRNAKIPGQKICDNQCADIGMTCFLKMHAFWSCIRWVFSAHRGGLWKGSWMLFIWRQCTYLIKCTWFTFGETKRQIKTQTRVITLMCRVVGSVSWAPASPEPKESQDSNRGHVDPAATGGPKQHWGWDRSRCWYAGPGSCGENLTSAHRDSQGSAEARPLNAFGTAGPIFGFVRKQGWNTIWSGPSVSLFVKQIHMSQTKRWSKNKSVLWNFSGMFSIFNELKTELI